MNQDELSELQAQLAQSKQSHKQPPAPPQPKLHKLTCPKCREKITVREEHLGLKLECTLCSHIFKSSLKTEEKLQAQIAREQEAQKRAEETARHLQHEKTEQEQRMAELAARGVLPDHHPLENDQPSLSYKAVSHRWPFDHHRHPPGWPVRSYVTLWLIVLVFAMVCWSVMFFIGVPAIDLVRGDESQQRFFAKYALWVMSWLGSAAAVLLFGGVVGVIVSHGKGRPHKEGFLYGFFLGPLGWLLAGQMPNHPDE